MSSGKRLRFAYQIGAVGEADLDDQALYREALDDAILLHRLGYDGAWMVEHHFSDYYPQPNPLLFLSHVAAACPGLGLGTSVMVLPWYDPVRFAEDLSMLSNLSSGELHIGMGRGTAKSEYDAFGIDMETARERFRETWLFTQRAMEGKPFIFDGKYVNFASPTKIRPAFGANKPKFYGAIGSMESAGIMGDLGLAPLCLSSFPDHLLKRILETWQIRCTDAGHSSDVAFPISIKCFVARTDEEAHAQALKYLPQFFALQVRHYQSDDAPWDNIEGYQQFSKMFANLRLLSDPTNLGSYISRNLVGSPETVARRLRQFADLGFDYFVLGNATYGVPRAIRHETIKLFAEEVMPRLRADLSVAAE